MTDYAVQTAAPRNTRQGELLRGSPVSFPGRKDSTNFPGVLTACPLEVGQATVFPAQLHSGPKRLAQSS